MSISSEFYLEHYQRLGAHWGQRNGPPYPLDYKNLSSEEKTKAKESAINRGDVKEVAKNKHEFSNEEIDKAVTRYNKLSLVSSIANKDVKDGEAKIDEIVRKISKTTDWAKKGVVAYNVGASIYNDLGGDKSKKLKNITLRGTINAGGK